MSVKKSTGLVQFAPAPAPDPQQDEERDRAKGMIVPMTMRLSRPDWERVKQLAVSEGVTVNKLMLRGLSRLFAEKGLPGVTVPRLNDAIAPRRNGER